MDREEGGRADIYGRREKQRGSARRAFPDQAGAKPWGCDTTTEITQSKADEFRRKQIEHEEKKREAEKG